MTKEIFLKNMTEWSSHRLLLWYALRHINGDVIEFGSGEGSTPFLYDYCVSTQRNFYSYENNKAWWSDKMGSYYVEDWNAADIYKKCAVILIDHAPGEHRHEAIAIMAQKAEIIVVHDSEEPGYMLDKVTPMFKYIVKSIGTKIETVALSNSIDVTKWSGKEYNEFKIL